MTNLKTTVTLLFLVLGLGLWVWLGEPQLEQKVVWDDKLILRHLDQAKVIRVDLIRPGEKLQLSVEREDTEEELEKARWRMTAPVADQADAAELRRVLNNLQFAQFQTRILGPEAKTFDKGAVLVQLQLTRKEGQPVQLVVYARRPSGEHPVEVAGREGIYLVRDGLISENLPTRAWAWRTKDVLALSGAALQRIELERLDQPTLALALIDGFWRLDGAEGEFAKKERATELMGALRALRATDVLSDAPTPEDLEKSGLARPQVRVALEAPPEGDGKPPRHEVVMVGNPVPNSDSLFWVRTSSKGAIYQASAAALVEAAQGKAADWRSDALFAITGGAETVTRLGLKGAEGEWVVAKDEQGNWTFVSATKIKVAEGKVKELLKDLVRLKILERVEGVAPSDVGLDAPGLQIGLDEGTLHRELHVGTPVEGRPGVYHVKRPTEGRLYLADLGLLPERLRDAQLELIEQTLFQASEFTLKKVALLEPDGKPVLEAESIKEKVGGSEIEKWKVGTQPGSAQADPDVFREFMRNTFVMLPVIRWVALDSEEARRATGLDAPKKVVIEVETFEEGKQDPVRKQRTILLGRREGARVHALNPDHAPAIGLIDANFLDRIARGFAKGKLVFSFDKFTARQLQLREGEATTFDLRRTQAGSWYLGDQLLGSTSDVEKLLEQVMSLEATRTERPSPARLAETGLDAPTRRLSVICQPMDGSPEQTFELLLGKPAGEREVWVMSKDGDAIGALFDEPLRALEKFLADHPEKSEDPFQTPPDDGGGGSEAPVDSPSHGGGEAPVGTVTPPGEGGNR